MIRYYDSEERATALNEAKEAGRGASVAKMAISSQIEAKNFISELMGGNEIDESDGNPTVDELAILALKARELSEEALTIVSSITGAPSPQSFREGFELLTPSDLKNMRLLFRRMGLQ